MDEIDKKDTNQYLIFFGSALIAVGVFIALYLVKELLSIYLDFGSSVFVTMMTEKLNGTIFLTIGDTDSITIGEGGAKIISIFFLFLLAWSGASISYALIKNGVQLLSPSLKDHVETIKFRITKVMENLRSK